VLRARERGGFGSGDTPTGSMLVAQRRFEGEPPGGFL
jgi:hypothetical protein